MTPPIHAAPDTPGPEHRPSLTCWCAPLYIGHDMASAAPVYRHRQPARELPGTEDRDPSTVRAILTRRPTGGDAA